MTTQNENRELVALQVRLATLQDELKQGLERAKRRARRNVMFTVALLLLVAGYWFYIYGQIAKINADFVAEWAYHRTVQVMSESRPAITQELKAKAPEVFDHLEALALQTPGIISNKIRDVGLEKTQAVLDHSEPVITKVVTDAVVQAKASTTAAGFDGKDPAQMDKMIDTLVAKLHTGVRDGIDKLYVDYDAKADEVVSYIDRLAAGKDLNQREQHLRQVIISFLAIDKKQKGN